MPVFIDLTGQRFGLLTVIECYGQASYGQFIWKCRCDCGTVVERTGTALRRQTSKSVSSCGCHKSLAMKTAKRTHGESLTPEYSAWMSMKRRCYDPRRSSYPNYGGRGVTVHEEWRKDFVAFLNHVGKRPSNKHSLDRIDVNGNYEPGNVRWATQQQQADNRRDTWLITYNDETRSATGWSRHLNLDTSTFYRLIALHGEETALQMAHSRSRIEKKCQI